MKKLVSKSVALSLIAAAVLSVTACGGKKVTVSGALNVSSEKFLNENSSFEDKAAYAIGVSLGTYVSRMKVEQDALGGELPSAAIAKGFNDGLNMNSELSREDIEGTLKALDAKVKEASDSRAQAVAETNLNAGNEFLAKKATEEGVQKTASGLLFKVLAEGKGDKAALGDTVSVIYKGTTIDGTVFDEQQNAVEFQLQNLIPGWVEGLQMMAPGAEYEFYIPANLAYGENGVGQVIKPNSALVFYVKLVDVKKPEAK